MDRDLLEAPAMSALDLVLPTPRLLEIDSVDLALSPAEAWKLLRHGDLGQSALTRALFALRTIPDRIVGKHSDELRLRLDDLRSTPEQPGFQVLVDRPNEEVVVGAIGKVWRLEIPFVHVADAEAFRAFDEPGQVVVAWAIQLAPLGEKDVRVTLELRVTATDEASWRKLRRYLRLIGPASRFIRRTLLSSLARAHGTPEAKEAERPLPGDELLADARAQLTHGITIHASPAAIWPWLVQMGCRRSGFYSIDALDNAGVRSAREVHAELQALHVGDVIPATPKGDDGFEVLRLEENRALILGGLFDANANVQLRFDAARPDRFWQVTWSFVLEPLDANTTRLHVRARAAFPEAQRLHATWIRPVHALMETAQLRHLAARVEGRMPLDDARDVASGVGGAARMVAALLTPFLRSHRTHWGLDDATAARAYPGDELVATPRWSWTHGVEIDAPVDEVWPWIAQIGADRGGFYSYQWLENLAGCGVRNAETIHPEWSVKKGDALVLHPHAEMRIAEIDDGRWFVAHAPADEEARTRREPWAEASWLFVLEPITPRRTRVVSRYRVACSDDLASRLGFGPAIVEPIGFVMDRRMLLGVRDRAEHRLGAR